MTRLAVYLLRAPIVELDGQPLEIPRRKLWALLACLSLNHTPLQRDTLAALIWPNLPQARARLSLSRQLSELKQLLGDKWFSIEHEHISLRRTGDFWLDVDEFRSLSTRKERGAIDLAALAAAAALYRDDFLTGFSLVDSLEFDDWQTLQSEELRRMLASVLEALVQGHIEQGAFGDALTFAHRWLALDTYHEPAHCQLMRLYALTGQRCAAIRQYRLCAQLLADEFQTAPSAETTDLYRDIVQGQFPPLESAISPLAPYLNLTDSALISSPRHNLSPPLTHFVGREDELSRLERLLVNPDVRLVTILGPGGIGKSRLAIEAAARHLDHFAIGVWFVSLAALEAPKRSQDRMKAAGHRQAEVQKAFQHPLVAALVDVLPATFHGDGSLADQLMAYLENKEMLIIYDNFEHLLAPDPELSAPFLIDLLRRAPKLKVLVTSRTRLNLQEEWLFALGGLHVPSDGALASNEDLGSAVTLFHQHASRVRQDFDLDAEQAHVLRICRLVDGVPLGIELAAPWVRLMSPAAIAAEIEHNIDFLSATLHNVPERHRSLRAVFDHSWRLLAPNEQAVLMRLSVLHGFARAEAEAIVGATLSDLSALVDNSFLQVTAEGRYALHEHLRHFALDQLQRIPNAHRQACDLHSHTYLVLVQTQGLRLYGNQVKQAMAAITVDIENVRAAWRWAQEHEHYDDLLLTVEGLGAFYEIKGWFADANELFSQAVAWMRQLGPAVGTATACPVDEVWPTSEHATGQDASRQEDNRQILLAELLAQQGWFMARVGLYAEAKEAIVNCITILEPMGERVLRQQAFAQYVLGASVGLAGTPDASILPFERSYKLFAQLDDTYGMGLGLVGLCQALYLVGRYDEADAIAKQGVEISNRIGEQVNKAYALSMLARSAHARGHYMLAEALHQECLLLRQESDDQAGVTFTFRYLGDTTWLQGRLEQARHYYTQCIRLCEAMNLRDTKRTAFYGLGNVALEQNKSDEALGCFQAGLALCTEANSPKASSGQVGLGRVALRHGDLVTAKRHLQSAVALTGTSLADSGLQPLAAWADYLAQTGEGRQAMITAAFILQEPSFTQEDRDVAAPSWIG